MKRLSERPFLPKPTASESQYTQVLMRCMTSVLGEIVYRANGLLPKDGSETAEAPIPLKTYTVATVPTAASWTGAVIFVSDETSGATLAFSDGTNWRRVQDRVVVS